MSKIIVVLIAVLMPLKLIASPLILVDEGALALIKAAQQSEQASSRYRSALNKLVVDADKFLLIENPTVMDKTLSPPTNDKHDYLSISRYWWPNPKTKEGLPWYRRDGKTNPDTQTDAVDRKRLGLMTKAVKTLAYAYYFTADEKYADKAVSVVRTWFLDKKTKMNPNLNFAQSVPGYPEGRRSGILDGRLIPVSILDSITLFSDSNAWTKEDAEAMNRWLKDYLSWLTTSDLGLAGAKQRNNHGSWYLFQISALAWFLEDKALVLEAVEATKRSLRSQMDEQGRQLHELERTRSFFYSCFNLEALSGVAEIAQKAGLSLWDYETSNGRSLPLAIDFLIPAAKGGAWKYPTDGVQPKHLFRVLSRANRALPKKGYDAILVSLSDGLEKEDIGLDQHQVLVDLERLHSK